MSGESVILRNARVLTLAGPRGPRRSDSLGELGIIEQGYVLVRDGVIASVGCDEPPDVAHSIERIDAGRCVVMPPFVDCHTHACWAGERFDEFDRKLAGASYLDILKSGGGIMATVRAVREADQRELVDLLIKRLGRMARLGTACVEVKSGYGLNTETELKMLAAIRTAAVSSARTILPTFLGAHAIDPESPDFIEQTISETLPAVVETFGPITCDAYCEDGAWSLEQTTCLFKAAAALGCPLRVHADQFNSLGMTRCAVEMGAVSVDHLEATTDEDLAALAESDTIGVALPCSGFQVDDRYAPGRRLVDLGGAVAIATNYNPGSAPTPSMPFAIALAVRKLGLTPAEAITAATHNAACVLGVSDAFGSIEVGRSANLQLWDFSDHRELAYEVATPGPSWVMIGGRVVRNDLQPRRTVSV